MMKDKHRPDDIKTASGLKKKKKAGKIDFSLNVVQFVRVDSDAGERASANFSQLTQLCKGQYQTVKGLDEIESYDWPDLDWWNVHRWGDRFVSGSAALQPTHEPCPIFL